MSSTLLTIVMNGGALRFTRQLVCPSTFCSAIWHITLPAAWNGLSQSTTYRHFPRGPLTLDT